MSGPHFDPLGGAKPMMEREMLMAVQELKSKAPGQPRAYCPADLYAAATLVDYLERKIEHEQGYRGQAPVCLNCPICEAAMVWEHRFLTFVCSSCNRTVTEMALAQYTEKAFQHIYMPPSHRTKIDPATYNPSLTSPIPDGLDPKDLTDKISEQATKEDEPMVLWRAWRLTLSSSSKEDWEKEKGKLRSVSNYAIWPHREPMVAIHWGSEYSTHADEGCPTWRCNCGIYGVKTLIQAQKWGHSTIKNQVQVLGKVVMWGKVLVFETGVKAQYAYPQKLWLTERGIKERTDKSPLLIANELSAAYGIDVEVDDGMFNLGLSHA